MVFTVVFKLSLINECFYVQCKTTFPLIESFLNALECLLSCTRQSDRVSIGAYELAFTILRVDPGTNAVAEQFATGSSRLLQSIHKAAISLLRVVFVSYPAHRQSMLVENLSLLCHVNTAKTPAKLYPLHFSNQTIGDNGRHASTAFIALLTCLQSVVDVSAGLETLSDKSAAVGPGEVSKSILTGCTRTCAIFASELFKVN